ETQVRVEQGGGDLLLVYPLPWDYAAQVPLESFVVCRIRHVAPHPPQELRQLHPQGVGGLRERTGALRCAVERTKPLLYRAAPPPAGVIEPAAERLGQDFVDRVFPWGWSKGVAGYPENHRQ